MFRSRQTTVAVNRLFPGRWPPIVVAGAVFGREVHAIELFVDRDGRPVAGVARVRPRVVFPRVVAELAGLRNGVEDPQALAGAHVVAANVSLDVFFRARRAAGKMCGANDDDVVAERGRRVEADVGRLEIDARLIDLRLQIDDAVAAERRDRDAGLRVQRNHVVAGSDGDDALVTLAVGPVREPASGALARARRRRACLRPCATSTTSRRWRDQRHDGAPRAGLHVHHVADDDRHRLHVEVGTRAEVVGLEAPRDAQVLGVVLVDLVERRIFRAARLGGIGAPLAVFRARAGQPAATSSTPEQQIIHSLTDMRSPHGRFQVQGLEPWNRSV